MCEEVIKDDAGKIIELRCTYDPRTKSGQDTSGKKVRGVIHWVSAPHAAKVTVRLYDTLFTKEDPEEAADEDFTANINPDSLITLENVPAEPALATAEPGSRFQFLRKGYFYLDPVEAKKNRLVYNRIVTLRDTWGKIKRN